MCAVILFSIYENILVDPSREATAGRDTQFYFESQDRVSSTLILFNQSLYGLLFKFAGKGDSDRPPL